MTWGRVRRSTRCMFGCAIAAPSYAWFGRWRRGMRAVMCVRCGRERYRLEPPAGRQVRDGKLQAVGDDGV